MVIVTVNTLVVVVVVVVVVVIVVVVVVIVVAVVAVVVVICIVVVVGIVVVIVIVVVVVAVVNQRAADPPVVFAWAFVTVSCTKVSLVSVVCSIAVGGDGWLRRSGFRYEGVETSCRPRYLLHEGRRRSFSCRLLSPKLTMLCTLGCSG